MEDRSLVVRIKAVTADFKKGMGEASAATKNLGEGMKRAGGPVGNLKNQLGAFAGIGVAGAVAFAGAKMVAFANDAIKAASDLGESVNAVEKTFGSASDRVLRFGQIAASVAGLSAREFNSLATVTGSMLTNMGFSMDAAAGQSIRLTTRAADMASVFNVDVSEALEAVNAGLRGETEPLRRFGVSLSDAAVRAKAVELGLAETTAEVDKHGKAVATLELIYEQTAKTQGDFLQTSGSLANSQRIAAAAAENAGAAFGQALAPLKADVLNMAADGLLLWQRRTDDAAKMAYAFKKANESMLDAVKAGMDPTTAFAAGIGTIAQEGILTGDQIDALAGSLGLSTEQMRLGTDQIRNMIAAGGIAGVTVADFDAAIAESTVNVDMYGEATGGAAGQVAGLAGKLREAEAAQLSLSSVMLEAIDPAAKAIGSMQRMTAAQENLIKVQQDSKASIEDVAQAELDVVTATFEAQAALDSVDMTNVEDMVYAIRTATGKTREEALLLLETLHLIDGTEVTTVVNINTVTSGGSGGSKSVSGFRAHGGPVNRGSAYMVGEQGPEVFRPAADGTIMSASSTVDQSTNWGGVNVVVNNPTAEPAAITVPRELRKLQYGGRR